MKVLIEPIDTHQDERGVVFEPITAVQLGGQRNAHVVFTEPGCVRGNHCHSLATETLAIFGSWLIRYRENGLIKELSTKADQVWRLTIPPGVTHAFKNTGTAVGVLVVFSNQTSDDAAKDLVRDVLIEP